MVSLSKKRIKSVFEASLKNVSNGKNPNISGEMKKAGYSSSSCRALKVVSTKTWEQLKAKYLNDEVALTTLLDLAGKKNEDKDNRLKASIEILKLKDRYPAGKLKLSAFEERERVIE